MDRESPLAISEKSGSFHWHLSELDGGPLLLGTPVVWAVLLKLLLLPGVVSGAEGSLRFYFSPSCAEKDGDSSGVSSSHVLPLGHNEAWSLGAKSHVDWNCGLVRNRTLQVQTLALRPSHFLGDWWQTCRENSIEC